MVVALRLIVVPYHQREDFLTMMPAELNRWRLRIGYLRLSRNVSPLSIIFLTFKLYWFRYWFIAVSILPFALTRQVLGAHSIASEFCCLPLVACVYQYAKTMLYVTVELFKWIPLSAIFAARYQFFHPSYLYFYEAYVACCALCFNSLWILKARHF